MNYRRIFLLIILLSSSTAVGAEVLRPFEAMYRLYVSGVRVGEVNITLQTNGNEFTYEKRSQSKGIVSWFKKKSIEETTQGSFENGQLQAKSYFHRDQDGDKVREETFMVSNGSASGEYKGKSYQLEVPAKILDRSSVELALMVDVAKGKKPLSYPVVEKGRLVDFQFQYNTVKSHSVPAGPYQCQEIETLHKSDKRSTRMCLAESLNYAPVHVTHTEKGTEIYMVLVKFRFTD